jgi:hypothetical protein
MSVANVSHRLCPSQCSPFALTVIRRLFPRIQTIKALLIFAGGSQIFPVHVNAVGASVDLRSPQFDEVKQIFLQPALVKIFLQPPAWPCRLPVPPSDMQFDFPYVLRKSSAPFESLNPSSPCRKASVKTASVNRQAAPSNPRIGILFLSHATHCKYTPEQCSQQAHRSI